MSVSTPLAAGPELERWLATHTVPTTAPWLVTGAAGFIGSHLVEALLRAGARVVAFDNLATGSRANLDAAVAGAGGDAATRLRFIEGDIRDVDACHAACTGVGIVLHQAALGSVPRSLSDPLTTHAVNANGFFNVLVAARDAGVQRVVFASSSSVYGDDATLPKVESRVGSVLSPYAASKRTNEAYASAFAASYGMSITGLRYFNVFGLRQDPHGPYAAVIPRWLDAIATGGVCTLNGDGSTSRDFCAVANVVQANLLAASSSRPGAEIFNVAVGAQLTLADLYRSFRDAALEAGLKVPERPESAPFRAGDIRHSLADISALRAAVGYEPLVTAPVGLRRLADAYFARVALTSV